MAVDFQFDRDFLKRLFELARQEDFGPTGDLTSRLLDEASFNVVGAWQLTAREAGRFCGAAILPMLIESLAPQVVLSWVMPDADLSDVLPGDCLAKFNGSVGQMLAAERTILNFLQHMSGVATMTHQFVKAVGETHAKIYDTRKTTPGFRMLDKYAVRCGGGHNHRTGLYDAVLIKDNHIAGVPTERLAHAVMSLLNGIQRLPSEPAFVEVECDNLDQFAQLLKVVGIDVILLDNFSYGDLRRAVEMRDAAGLRGKVELEASGGATLKMIEPLAATGVERIAVGAITHSAPALDLGLDAV
ncbi:MAG: carboxylating nicotinate-nucleotide diphosphorylase [Phycisphaerales bacterium]|nr:carboxylating nicotinate-nucleotide diphosphorylase [Phycisphaerales bacterium]MCB9857408.1 carboxylating nicotinate-nucleotide diphosphorylase [Phycisphaerales bacterium]